jgi:hypothetical protein
MGPHTIICVSSYKYICVPMQTCAVERERELRERLGEREQQLQSVLQQEQELRAKVRSCLALLVQK